MIDRLYDEWWINLMVDDAKYGWWMMDKVYDGWWIKLMMDDG